MRFFTPHRFTWLLVANKFARQFALTEGGGGWSPRSKRVVLDALLRGVAMSAVVAGLDGDGDNGKCINEEGGSNRTRSFARELCAIRIDIQEAGTDTRSASTAPLLRDARSGDHSLSLFEIVLDLLSEIESLNAMLDFVHLADSLVTKPGEDLGEIMTNNEVLHFRYSSELGVFVRRMVIDFHEADFGDLSDAFKRIENFKAALQCGAQDSVEEHDAIPSDDAAAYLDFQVMRETSGLHPPEGLIANITKLHSLNPSMERVHYLKFLIAMRTGNLNDAEESLHRFYDYSKRFGNANNFQYALLDLAILHASFGHYDEAIMNLRSCVSSARSRKDNDCLAFALLWMSKLKGDAPKEALALLRREPSQLELLSIVVEMCKDNPQLANLKHEAQLSRIELLSALGENSENIINELYSVKASTLRSTEPDTGTFESTRAIQESTARLWELYGTNILSQVNATSGVDLDASGVATISASNRCLLARQAGASGRFEDALLHLDEARKMYPRFSHIPQSREWIWTSLHLFFRRALNQCQLRTARCLIPQLHVAGSYKEEWRLVALMEEAAYLEKFESPDSAHQILFTLVEELQANEKRQYQKLKIEALLRLAQLIMNADNTTDTTSLPHLLTARQLLTKKPYPVELHCRAAILVAYHMLRGGSPGLPGRALNIVRTASQRIGANDLATTSDPAAVPTIDLGTLAAIERALAECKAEVILAHEGPEVGNAAADETMDIGDQASRFEKESFTWDTVLGHCRRALSLFEKAGDLEGNLSMCHLLEEVRRLQAGEDTEAPLDTATAAAVRIAELEQLIAHQRVAPPSDPFLEWMKSA